MTITYRPATPDDSPTLFAVSEHSIADLALRKGYGWDSDPDDPAAWQRRQPLFAHLAATADQCWLAQDSQGEVVGYARSIVRAGVRELTELFVLPGQQSGGVGRELLARAFPAVGAERRLIIATSDTRALALYLKSGMSARFPIFDFRRRPEAMSVPSDLTFEPMGDAGAVAGELAAVDQHVLGYRRDDDHAWFARERSGYVARRHGQTVGYGYLGEDSGPFAVLDAADLPAVLAHAETLAHARGQTDLGFEVPLINRAATDYLLGRGYKMQPFFAFFMSDAPLGRFENYVLFSPPYFI